MNPENSTNRKYKIVGVILILILASLGAGWLIGQSGNNNDQNATKPSQPENADKSASDSDVKEAVSYMLPDGWTEGSCTNSAGVVYIIPNDSKLDCGANPSAPIKVYMDPQNTTDCSQLNNAGNVTKHVCISLYIDGHKSLKASTEYPKSSEQSSGKTVSDYYIDTGKGVVKVEYAFTSDNSYQADYDQLATGTKVK